MDDPTTTNAPILRTIVLTGGPCGGKTTALGIVKAHCENAGWRVLVVSEAATRLIAGGIAPWTCENMVEFQKRVAATQKASEDIARGAVPTLNARESRKTLILCDRGVCDGYGYNSDEEFIEVLDYVGLTPELAYQRYDAVFHLASAADGAPEFFTLENNETRKETIEEAIAIDRRIAKGWRAHPHFTSIGNETDFVGKMDRLLAAIDAYLEESCH